ncbi:MAG: hypothetical protein HY014_03750 [Acidobacteria bacterium]|nr:hypothetical protein [Acidobacteriota bacterium]MBI3487267.1 hypothetical protein [Acidobacteriota bacterium]
MRLVLGLLLLMSGAPAFSQAPPPPPPPGEAAGAGSRDILDVPPGATLIEEKSLPLDVSLNAPSAQATGGKSSGRGITDNLDQGKRGMRLYQFTMAPKETLRLKLNAFPSDKIVMSFAPPVKPDDLTPGIKRANQMPQIARRSAIELMNTTSEPYQVVLRMIGTIDVPYKLEISRK